MKAPVYISHPLSTHSFLKKVLVLENAPTVTLAGGTNATGALHEGIYILTLRVTVDHTEEELEDNELGTGRPHRRFDPRHASTSVELKLVDKWIPDVGVRVNQAITTLSQAGEINADTKVVLTGVAGYAAPDTDPARIEGRWEVSGVEGLDLTNRNVAPLGMRTGSFDI
jgi:hypothetical protein